MNVVEDYLRLDIRTLMRKDCLNLGSIPMTWSQGEEKIGSALIRFETAFVDVTGNGRTQRIPVRWWPCNYDGARPAFQCPRCRRGVYIVYFADRWWCRWCHGLDYVTQTCCRPGRMQIKKERIIQRLGGRYCDGFPDKPKGMHWRTYQRFIDRYEAVPDIFPQWMVRVIEEANARSETSPTPSRETLPK